MLKWVKNLFKKETPMKKEEIVKYNYTTYNQPDFSLYANSLPPKKETESLTNVYTNPVYRKPERDIIDDAIDVASLYATAEIISNMFDNDSSSSTTSSDFSSDNNTFEGGGGSSGGGGANGEW